MTGSMRGVVRCAVCSVAAVSMSSSQALQITSFTPPRTWSRSVASACRFHPINVPRPRHTLAIALAAPSPTSGGARELGGRVHPSRECELDQLLAVGPNHPYLVPSCLLSAYELLFHCSIPIHTPFAAVHYFSRTRVRRRPSNLQPSDQHFDLQSVSHCPLFPETLELDHLHHSAITCVDRTCVEPMRD